MGKQEFQKRLAEISMSEHEADVYFKFVDAVKNEIQQLRELVDHLRSKGKTRLTLCLSVSHTLSLPCSQSAQEMNARG